MDIKFSSGQAASNAYLYNNSKLIAQLTYDWTFNSIYFKEYPDGKWVTYSYSDIKYEDNIYFKQLANYTFKRIPLEANY